MLTILRIVLQKLLKKKWLTLSLVFGMTVCVALISSIPLFSDGVLQRMLIQELEQAQKDSNLYSGYYMIACTDNDWKIRTLLTELQRQKMNFLENPDVRNHYQKKLVAFTQLENTLRDNIVRQINLPVLASCTMYVLTNREIAPLHKTDFVVHTDTAKLKAVRNLKDHVKLVAGRFPDSGRPNGAYEVMVSTQAQQEFGIVLDEAYLLTDPLFPDYHLPLTVKAVGVFSPDTENDIFWSMFNIADDIESASLFMDEDTLAGDLVNDNPELLLGVHYRYLFDYHRISMTAVGSLAAAQEQLGRLTNQINEAETFAIVQSDGFSATINTYLFKSTQMLIFGWCLNTNIIFLLFAYIFMTAWLIVDQEKNEIALLASRGAKKGQIIASYLIEGLVLGLVALLIGPLLGILFVRLLGSTSGFLEFVNRKALPVVLGFQIPLFSAVAVIASLLMILTPVSRASSQSIVMHKHSLAEKNRKPAWKKLFIDLILVAVAAVNLVLYALQPPLENVSPFTTAAENRWNFDPFLFIMPVILIVGLTFLFMRLYPFLVRLVFHVGKRFWGPVGYITLLRINRNFASYHFLAFFLIMTLAIGIFSAATARTINQNAEDRIMYSNGADIALQEHWRREKVGGDNPYGPSSAGEEGAASALVEVQTERYIEPSFDKYKTLGGVRHAARVLRTIAVVESGSQFATTDLIAVNPGDFGKVAWFRSGLLDRHINTYLNMLAKNPRGCLISRSIHGLGNVQIGDILQVRKAGTRGMPLKVLGIIDFWPTWNPYFSRARFGRESLLVVANYRHIRENIPLEPYEVWLSLEEDVPMEVIYEQFASEKIPIQSIRNSRQEIIRERNDPFELGLNGMLTIGFLVSLALSGIGFFIYWAISFKSRSLQFGIFRALGLPPGKITLMIVIENILITGVAIGAGLLIGLAAGHLYIPYYQGIFGAPFQAPPFRIISAASDLVRIMVFIGVTIMACIGILSFVISRMKIAQTLKLGED